MALDYKFFSVLFGAKAATIEVENQGLHSLLHV